MSFESIRSIGRAATLLIVVTTVTAPVIVVAAFFLGLLQNILLFTVLYSALSYSGQVLFLVAMNRFADYYRDRAIFRNALYGFITAVVGSVVFTILIFGVFSSLRALLPTTSTPGTPPSASFLIAFIGFFAVIWLGAFIVALVQSLFYRQAFYALEAKSGESNFRQAGLFMLIGGVLTIIFVGALIFFVGWIFAVLGFFHMQPGTSQTGSPQQTAPSSGRVRYCPTCGKENSESDTFCSRCGSRLYPK
jgi:uncharacterized membrane protein